MRCGQGMGLAQGPVLWSEPSDDLLAPGEQHGVPGMKGAEQTRLGARWTYKDILTRVKNVYFFLTEFT